MLETIFLATTLQNKFSLHNKKLCLTLSFTCILIQADFLPKMCTSEKKVQKKGFASLTFGYLSMYQVRLASQIKPVE